MLIRFWSFFLKTTRSLVGVMEAYLFYMQMAVVRFHYEVQKGNVSLYGTAIPYMST